jgi:hypothetical protein
MSETKQIDNSVYTISKTGVVYNTKYKRQLKGRIIKSGYCVTDIVIDGKKKSKYIHRLIAEAFLENPNNYPDVHHKDNNKSNNNICNLEWTTRSKNCRMSSKPKKNGLPRGVSWNNVAKKYQCQLSQDCKIRHLGYFSTAELAHARYLEEYKLIMGFDCIYK